MYQRKPTMKKIVPAAIAFLVWTSGLAVADLLGRGKADEYWAAGQAAMEDGFYELAAEKFHAYIDESFFRGNKARGSVWLAQALMAQGKADEAAEWMEQHMDWADSGEDAASYTFWAAQAQFTVGHFAAVTDTLFRFERKFPDSALRTQVFRLRSSTLLKLGLRDNALTSFASFQERYPDAPEMPDNLLDWARVLIEDGNPAEAEPLLRQVVERFPDSNSAVPARLWLGRMLMDRGQFAEAAPLLDALARSDKAEADLRAQAWYALGRMAEQQTNNAVAVESYVQGENIAADMGLRFENRINRARLLAGGGQTEQAATLLEESIKSMPNHPRAGSAQLELAGIWSGQGQYARALEAYQNYLEAFSDETGQAEAQFGKAWCLWHLNRFAEAALVFEKAAALQPDAGRREVALTKAADAYFANGQF